PEPTPTPTTYTYKVIYDANGGTGGPSNATNANTTVTVWQPMVRSAVPTRKGYTFTGWNTAADGSGTSYKSGSRLYLSSDGIRTITLYAQWSRNYTYKYTKVKRFLVESIRNIDYGVYFDNKEATLPTTAGYNHETVDGTDYLAVSTVGYDKSHFYSHTTYLDITALASKMRDASGNSAINEEFIAYHIENGVQSFYRDNGIEALRKYSSAADFMNNEMNTLIAVSEDTLRELMAADGYGRDWTSEKYFSLCRIWAEAMDEWCENDGMGTWDRYLYGNENHNYTPYDGYKGLPGIMYACGFHSLGMRKVIVGSAEVYMREKVYETEE
ncbi:MAG: InlB B-repeat-containing protein, partial [Eubacteriales bacterium]|nr:InlB B-repeat-containing protein [Eubacteriales bacterium]